MSSASDRPVVASFDSEHLTIGAGAAIFHVASSRVVVCYHPVHEYWFLPKGRRDANEETGFAAEREGFEESGYRNRLLPTFQRHRQPRPHNPSSPVPAVFSIEPVWMQLVPVSHTAQYVLFWYIAETLAPDIETSVNSEAEAQGMTYQIPPRFPAELTLAERVKQDGNGYEPVRHENTGVDAEEAQYASYLLSIPDAMEKLKGTVMTDVVRKGWKGIQLRWEMEGKAARNAKAQNSQ
ncbi:MAG: hypothetical protein Q9191_005072 [Dirinaria sp. TL-2023a]